MGVGEGSFDVEMTIFLNLNPNLNLFPKAAKD